MVCCWQVPNWSRSGLIIFCCCDPQIHAVAQNVGDTIPLQYVSGNEGVFFVDWQFQCASNPTKNETGYVRGVTVLLK